MDCLLALLGRPDSLTLSRHLSFYYPALAVQNDPLNLRDPLGLATTFVKPQHNLLSKYRSLFWAKGIDSADQ